MLSGGKNSTICASPPEIHYSRGEWPRNKSNNEYSRACWLAGIFLVGYSFVTRICGCRDEISYFYFLIEKLSTLFENRCSRHFSRLFSLLTPPLEDVFSPNDVKLARNLPVVSARRNDLRRDIISRNRVYEGAEGASEGEPI